MKIDIIMIAHNQMDLVKQGLKAISLFARETISNLIIVDNASEDGLAEWLVEKENYNYVICDEGIENYAAILNMVIKEFKIIGDILILSPTHIILLDAIRKMQETLHKKEDILAISPSMIYCREENGEDYTSAMEYVKQRENVIVPDKQKLGLEEGAILIKGSAREVIGEFDERLVLPRSVWMDFLFRGILKGYFLYECGNAFVYKVGSDSDVYSQNYGIDVDRPILKEKWNMNYFNNCPNYRLISCIQDESDASIKVLEIGCDCGVNLLEIKNRYPKMQAFGVELNERAGEIASHIAEIEIGNIEDKNIKFSDEKFDYIMFGDVLEHLRDPEGTLHYCKNLLNSTGKIIACIPNLMHYSVMKQLINGDFTYKDMGLLDRTHIHFFTYNEIVRMFNRVGCHVEKIETVLSLNEIEQEDVRFIEELCTISGRAEPFMFYTFQYIVVAEKIKNNF